MKLKNIKIHISVSFKKFSAFINSLNNDLKPLFSLFLGIGTLFLMFQANTLIHTGNKIADQTNKIVEEGNQLVKQANNVSKQQAEFQKRESSATFFIKEIDSENEIYEIISDKGYATNIEIQKMVVVTLYSEKKSKFLRNVYYLGFDFKEDNNKSSWNYENLQKKFDSKLLCEKINNVLVKENQIYNFKNIYSTEYFRIKYRNYQDNEIELYFHLDARAKQYKVVANPLSETSSSLTISYTSPGFSSETVSDEVLDSYASRYIDRLNYN